MPLKDPEARKQYGIERRAKLKNDPVYQEKLKQRRLATEDKKAEYDSKRRQSLPKNYNI